MDCGPACLQMVAKYYGKDYSHSELSSISGIGAEGTSLLGMSEAAERIGFNTFSVKTTLEKMREEEEKKAEKRRKDARTRWRKRASGSPACRKRKSES